MDKPESSVVLLEKNEVGRDFVVGDIHGHFELLELLLGEIAFNKECDRVISVGDLIDRGPESEKALDYWQQPWFFAVRGNHEAMLLGAQSNYFSRVYQLWMDNGGEWAENASEALLNEMANCISQLPYVISVETQLGVVGIAHADVPITSWAKLLQKLDKDKLRDKELEKLLWSRATFKQYLFNPINEEYLIKGVRKLYLGHNIVSYPSLYGNIMFIDTGAYRTGCLTAVDLQTEETIMVQTESDLSQKYLSAIS